MAKPQEVRSVDSFSQLPFIRPAPAPAPAQPRDATIRLFGCDFSNDQQHRQAKQQQQHDAAAEGDSPDAANGSTVTSESNGGGGAKSGSGGAAAAAAAAAAAERKFECHYCCRNFPTSQALGGHQNAHKRERQHAKRAHLQASLAMHHRYVPGHMYGLFNYHHLAGGAGGRYVDHHAPPPLPPPLPLPPAHYPMWTSAGPAGPYGVGGGGGGPGSMSQPINGSPVPPGLWRVPPPAATTTTAPAMENFGGMPGRHGGAGGGTAILVGGPAAGGEGAAYKDDEKAAVMSLLSPSPSLSSCSSTSPEKKLGRCELGQYQKESVSLDLHL